MLTILLLFLLGFANARARPAVEDGDNDVINESNIPILEEDHTAAAGLNLGDATTRIVGIAVGANETATEATTLGEEEIIETTQAQRIRV